MLSTAPLALLPWRPLSISLLHSTLLVSEQQKPERRGLFTDQTRRGTRPLHVLGRGLPPVPPRGWHVLGRRDQQFLGVGPVAHLPAYAYGHVVGRRLWLLRWAELGGTRAHLPL